jgi:predicted HicB family RNase H-like nuclease
MSFLKTGRPKTPKEEAIAAVTDVTDTDDKTPATETQEQPTAASKIKTQRFNVDLPVELHRQLKAKASSEGVKLNELATRLFTEYLSKHSKE